MTNQLRPVTLDFAGTAPLRLVFEAEATAPPEAVFEVLTEVETCPEWFSELKSARSLDDGKRREVRLKGGPRFVETILAVDAPERYAYRADETNLRGLTAVLEEWHLSPSASGTGTVVRYTFAIDGNGLVRFFARLAKPGAARMVRKAVRKLDQRIAAAA